MRCEHTRRRTVKAIGAVVLGTSLAGCRGDGDRDGDSDNGGEAAADSGGNNDDSSGQADGDDDSSGQADGDDDSSGQADGDDSNPRGIDEIVEMTDALEFEPATLNVEIGETVAWENVGSVTHTVTAVGERIPADAAYFASGGAESERAARDGYPSTGGIDGGESYEHTFETTGTYEYFCLPHEDEGMTGTIFVFERGGQGHPPGHPGSSIGKP